MVLDNAFALRTPSVRPAPLDLPPVAGPALVSRARLLRPLATCPTESVAIVCAPAGYGKTTLLTEWAMRDVRPFTWVRGGAAGRALRAVEQTTDPHVIVLDDAHLAAGGDLRRVLDAARDLPSGAVLAVAARSVPTEAVARLRAERRTIELTAAELAMTDLEATRMLRAAGLRLDAALLGRLLERTEGWPAALSLAVAAIAAGPDVARAVHAFSGADRFVTDYLDLEVLAGLTEGQRLLLRRTSVLERLSGSLCDAVLEADGTAGRLRSLARAGVPLEPLDRSDGAFRQHPLLASMLRAELARVEPSLERALHRRAALWHAEAGESDAAIRHAVACRDTATAGRVLWSITPQAILRGRCAVLAGHLARFRDQELATEPGLALAAAACNLAEGRPGRAQRWAQAAERAAAATGEWEPDVALVRACLARDGVARMAADAAHVRDQMPLDGAAHCIALYLGGVAAHLQGEHAAARERLHDAACRSAGAFGVLAALCHAQLAALAIGAGDWHQAGAHAEEAHATLAAGPAPPEAQALELAVFAVVAAQRGDVAQARHDAAHADRLLADSKDGVWWLLAQTHVWLARAEIRLSDGPTGRMHLTYAARHAAQVKDAPVLTQWIHDGWERADAFAGSVTGDGPTLTNAELRVLRMLPSHMTFREIGERLHVSTNTVKTQALSVYRKLDVSCRSEAVDRGRTAGVIDG
jgi:LuxR family maltose regulon positive regulatory protein